jgi:hypothetical protein
MPRKPTPTKTNRRATNEPAKRIPTDDAAYADEKDSVRRAPESGEPTERTGSRGETGRAQGPKRPSAGKDNPRKAPESGRHHATPD